jgi:hypothetical protein
LRLIGARVGQIANQVFTSSTKAVGVAGGCGPMFG